MSLLRRAETWNLDIDRYLNRIIPPSPLHRLPTQISRFLGYRKEDRPDVGNVLGALYAFVGAVCGLAVIAAIFNNADTIQARHPPALIASFGASAILEYNTIRSPLGQPRNALLGHTFSALIGVATTKLFLLHPAFDRLRWIAGAVSCGLASAVMLLTGTVHPPGGASAVLAATSPEVTAMGWGFVGLVVLGTTLMLLVGLVVNNLQRRFPIYWWTPGEVGRVRKVEGDEEKGVEDVEGVEEVDGKDGGDFASTDSDEDGSDKDGGKEGKEKGDEISISASGVFVPRFMTLEAEEMVVLGRLRDRLGKDALGMSLGSARSSTDVTVVPSHRAASEKFVT